MKLRLSEFAADFPFAGSTGKLLRAQEIPRSLVWVKPKTLHS